MTVQAVHSRLTEDGAAPPPRTGLHGIDFDITAGEIQARIGAAIRLRRRTVEVTLADLARACDVSFQQVQKYESGACSISAAQLWNIACALRVPVSHFYEAARIEA